MLRRELPAGGASMPASSGLGASLVGRRMSPGTVTLFLARGICIGCILNVEGLGEFRIPFEVVAAGGAFLADGLELASRQRLQPPGTNARERWAGFRPTYIDDVVRRIDGPQ